jgi:hypothetical protein
VDRVVGLEGVRADTAIMQTPDGNGRLELTKFHSRSTKAATTSARRRTRRVSATSHSPVEDIDAVVAGRRARGAELVVTAQIVVELTP